MTYLGDYWARLRALPENERKYDPWFHERAVRPELPYVPYKPKIYLGPKQETELSKRLRLAREKTQTNKSLKKSRSIFGKRKS